VDLGVSEGNGELDWVGRMKIDWPTIGRGSPLHASNDFLPFVAIINVRCKHLFVCVVIAGDEKRVKTE